MCILKRKAISQSLLLIFAVASVGAEVSSITLPELRQIITGSREYVATARLVYVEEINDNRPIAGIGNEDPLEYKLLTINRKYRRIRVDAILDYKTKSLKNSLTDLRDVDALLKENDLAPKQKMNVSCSKTLLNQDTYEMEFTDSNVMNGPPLLGLFEHPGSTNHLYKMIYLGVIDEKLLSYDLNPTLTEIDVNGQSLLRIELTVEGQNATKAIIKIDCVPSLGYRFRRVQWHSEGQLIKETIADDYRDVNDVNNTIVVPYPFLYIERSFDKDGKIRRETKYVMDKVELGVDLSPDDFKTFVPAGTRFIDDVSKVIHTIEKSGYIGIDDALSIGTKRPLKR